MCKLIPRKFIILRSTISGQVSKVLLNGFFTCNFPQYVRSLIIVWLVIRFQISSACPHITWWVYFSCIIKYIFCYWGKWGIIDSDLFLLFLNFAQIGLAFRFFNIEYIWIIDILKISQREFFFQNIGFYLNVFIYIYQWYRIEVLWA